MSFGLRARSWQIGATGSPDAVRRDDLAELVDAATRSLGDFVPDPTILIPCTAEQLVDATEALPGYHIAVPYHVQPDALGSYAAEWPVGRRELLVTFDLLPLDQYTPRQQLTDMALRVLHAWRAGLPRLAIKSPWSWHGERGSLLPDPASAVWPHLAARLSGRRFGGELALADGVHCWILEGSAPDDAALVAWNAWMSPGEQPVIRARLAAGPIEVVDIFGNITRVGAREGLHTVPLSEVPVFMEGVNVNLAKFRAGFVIDPDFVPSQSRSHDHEIVLSNPWDVLVSGTIRLVETDRWRISPRVQSFVIRPDQEVRLPIDILFDGRPLAGRSHIVAEVDLVADRDYRLRVQADLEVGLEGIEFVATWSVARSPLTGRDDLVITQYVTNNTQQGIAFDAYLRAPDVRHQRRALGSLAPGETAVRSFPILDGVALLAGKQIHVGVTERGGVAQLNKVIEIPGALREKAEISAAAAE
ncbi:MAG: hypothetical protein ACYSTY_14770 [Planctomycetota bacterium]|jgi:hypothetical protein